MEFAQTGPLAVLKQIGALVCSIRSMSPAVMSLKPIKSAGQPVSVSHRIGPWFEPSSLEPHCCGSKRAAAAQCADSATAVRKAVATAGAAGALPPPLGFRLRERAFFFAAGLPHPWGQGQGQQGYHAGMGTWHQNAMSPRD